MVNEARSMEDGKSHGIPKSWLGSLDLRRLQAFVVAARTGSFAMAAQALNVVPSAISHAIKGLEEEFDCGLFQRRGPRVILTHLGHRLLPFAQEIFNDIASLRSEVTRIREQGDCVRLAAPEMIICSLLPTVLPQFHHSLPFATFELAHGATGREIARLIEARQVDVAVAVAGTLGADCIRRDLFEEEIGFYCAEGHLLAAREQVVLADLQHCVLMTCDQHLRELVVNRFMPSAARRGSFWVLGSMHSVLEMAKSHGGVAVLPRWVMRREVHAGQFFPLKLTAAPLTRTWAGHWPASAPRPWAAELLLNLIETAARSLSGWEPGAPVS